MSKSALTVLREARELISDQRRWTQKSYAKDDTGLSRLVDSPDATCWCAEGATLLLAKDDYVSGHDARKMLYASTKALFGESIVGTNDYLGHAEIIRAFDDAIAKADAEART